MEQVLEKSLSELKNAMEEDPRFILLKEKEENLYCEEVVALVQRKNAMEDEYQRCLSVYGENSEETKNAQRALYEAKLALDNHPLVKEYNEAFIAVKDITMVIDDIIFGPFRKRSLKEF